jgi:L-alanine-DL-glutamate epimerase-like enolase superfamily enzyme
LEPYRLKWIEEPLPPHDLQAHARLRAAVSTPIGTGEQEWNVEGYRRLIGSGGVDVVQLDPGRCQGLTGCRHVVKLIEAENLHFTAHTWSSALNTAASMSWSATRGRKKKAFSTCGVLPDWEFRCVKRLSANTNSHRQKTWQQQERPCRLRRVSPLIWASARDPSLRSG